MTLTVLLFAVCLILLGATTAKPLGYVVVGLAVLAMLLHVMGPRL